MIIQIYNTHTPEEGIALAKAGADHIGMVLSTSGLPGEIDPKTAKKIVETVGSRATKVALTVETDINAIVNMVKFVKPDILHLSGDIEKMTPDKIAKLRPLIPSTRIMQAIPVINQQAFEIAQSYQNVADYLIVDSFSKNIGGIGAAGFTHDWNISRAIVAASRIPVILAGGLSPENVAEAIKFVRPWGVDSLTFTNSPMNKGKIYKDIERVKAFVRAATEAAKEISE